ADVGKLIEIAEKLDAATRRRAEEERRQREEAEAAQRRAEEEQQRREQAAATQRRAEEEQRKSKEAEAAQHESATEYTTDIWGGSQGGQDSRTSGKHSFSSRGVANVDSYEGSIDSRLVALVSCATRATFNLLLERTIALSTPEMMVFLDALHNCGMIADESGHLLPELFRQLY